MNLPRLLTLFFLTFTAATLQAEHAEMTNKADPIMASPAQPERAGITDVSMSQDGNIAGGHQCHKKHGAGHGAKKHRGGQGGMKHGSGGMKHGGGGSGMKQQVTQQREDMEKRIRRIEERLAVMQTMLEQLLQR